MEKDRDIRLVNNHKIHINVDDLEGISNAVINEFVKPYYENTNDWNDTLHQSIREIERISSILQLSRGDLINIFLRQIENRLTKDLANLQGTDKIEILFEALDDYVENLHDIMVEGGTKEEIRLKVANLVENLNLFETSELILYFAKNKYERTQE